MLDSSEYTICPGIMKRYFSVTGILGVVQKFWEGEEEHMKLSHVLPCLVHVCITLNHMGVHKAETRRQEIR